MFSIKDNHLITIRLYSLTFRLVLCHHQLTSPTSLVCHLTVTECQTVNSDRTQEWDLTAQEVRVEEIWEEWIKCLLIINHINNLTKTSDLKVQTKECHHNKAKDPWTKWDLTKVNPWTCKTPKEDKWEWNQTWCNRDLKVRCHHKICNKNPYNSNNHHNSNKLRKLHLVNPKDRASPNLLLTIWKTT